MIARASTLLEDEDPNAIRRWAVAASIVVVIHVVVLCPYIYFYRPEEIGDDATPISIDLSPSDDTVDQAQVLPTPDQPPPPPQVETPQPPPPPPPPEPSPAVIEAQQPPPPPPPPVVEEQQPQQARTKGGAPRVAPSWLTAVSKRLQQFKRYPSKAHDELGVVSITFTVDRTGHVLAHEISQSSGHPALDAEVSSMIERAQPLPPFPDSMTQSQIDITVPITFYR